MTDNLEQVTGDTGVSADTAEHGQPRDENGRFASNQPAQPDGQAGQAPAQDAPIQQQAPPSGYVPVQAMDERVGKWRKRHDDVYGQNQLLQRQISELMARLPQQQQPAQTAPDFFENPTGAVDHRFQENIRGVVSPIQQQIYAIARQATEGLHGADKVGEAVRAFDEAVALGQIDPREAEQVKRSPNPFHEAVQWHQRKAVLSEVGTDPAAYRERIRKEILAEMQGQQQQPAQQQASPQVMPQSFTQTRSAGQGTAPQWSGPTPLSDLMGR